MTTEATWKEKICGDLVMEKDELIKKTTLCPYVW